MSKTGRTIAIVAGVALVGGLLIYPPVVRAGMRKRLDEALDNPYSASDVGGLNKLQHAGVFDLRKFQSGTSKHTISRMEARERARMVWDNYGGWMWQNDNETAIISAFNGLSHLDDVSLIAHEFYGLYDEELLTVLEKALDNDDKAQYQLLMGKIMTLPKD